MPDGEDDMPAYSSWSVVDLKAKVSSYGLKPTTKTTMVAQLEHIWKQTRNTTHNTMSPPQDSIGAMHAKDNDDEQEDDSDESEYDDTGTPEMEESTAETPLDESQKSHLEAQIYNYVMNDKPLYHSILLFKPFEVTVLHKKLSESGIKCSIPFLVGFLDKQSILHVAPSSAKQKSKRQERRARKKNKSS